jgi:hypothetical protein
LKLQELQYARRICDAPLIRDFLKLAPGNLHLTLTLLLGSGFPSIGDLAANSKEGEASNGGASGCSTGHPRAKRRRERLSRAILL